ncbi:hypothetical protein ACA910_010433 [Epithemia clementina (nom. ined.)]
MIVILVSAISLYAMVFLSVWESRHVVNDGSSLTTISLSVRSSRNDTNLIATDNGHQRNDIFWLPSIPSTVSNTNNTKPPRGYQQSSVMNEQVQRNKRSKTTTIINLKKDEDNWNPVRFIAKHQLKAVNPFYFSATWWQSTERFLKRFNSSRIAFVEGAVFHFIVPYLESKDELRMTSDWLKFSVEHLSRAWKISGFVHEHETESYCMFVDKLLNYTVKTLASVKKTKETSNDGFGRRASTNQTTFSLSPTTSVSSAMTETIAVIAFMPYKSGRSPTRGQVLTTANLAATLASLIRVNCGRVLIVVDRRDFNKVTAQIVVATKQLLLEEQQQQQVTQEHHQTRRTTLESLFGTFPRKLAALVLNVSETFTFEYKVHQTEIGLVVVNCTKQDGTTSPSGQRLVPKAALLGLKKAFVGSDLLHTQQWLGRTTTKNENITNKWRFTYLTEPDTILQARLDAMPWLSREVRKGDTILVPHRLQPVPHERDLPNYNETRMVPASGNFSNVLIMGPNSMCCDDGNAAPGFVKRDVCGTFWWGCGFARGNNTSTLEKTLSKQTLAERHFRLAHYQLMDLEEGTRIVSLAGSEHARRCVPTMKSIKNGFDCP